MTDTAEIEAKFWKSLKSDRTIMLGLVSSAGEAQPMTAQIEGEEGGPIWIFTSSEAGLVHELDSSRDAFIHFAGKGHDLFAAVSGRLTLDTDRATIDRLWNPFVAAWFEGGKEDPKLRLLRFDPSEAKIWLNDHSLFAGVKLLLGRDPKESYRDKVAEVRLN